MPELRQEHSVAELLGELSQDLGLLIRQEALLAKTEMQRKLSKVAGDLASLATGGIVAMVAALALTAAVILLLIDPVGLKPWLAALIVGATLAIVGFSMLRRGIKDLKQIDPTPRRAVESVKDDIQWAKEQT